jgi:transketolase
MRQKALDTVHQMAKSDPRVIFIGSDLGFGTLESMKEELPNQFFMEGISEQHIIGFAAGLASEGFLPFFNTIGTFITRRAYEQIFIDIALHNLPVRLLSGGGGLVYAPLGPTHTSIEDFSLMLSIPNMQVFAPADSFEVESIIRQSTHDLRPYFIRLGKGGEQVVTSGFKNFEFRAKKFGSDNPEILLITTGTMLQTCLKSQDFLYKLGLKCQVLHYPYLNKLEVKNDKDLFNSAKVIFCIEEHVVRGGLMTQLLHELHANRIGPENVYHKSIPLDFIDGYGSQDEQRARFGLCVDQIVNDAKKHLRV